MHNNNFFKITFVAAVAAIVTTLMLVGGFFWLVEHEPETIASVLKTIDIENQEEAEAPSAPVSTQTLVIDAVKEANPAVVAITVSKNVPVYERYFENSPNPFGGFFGEPYFFRLPQVRQNGTELQEVGGGSGFLVSPDGYIVTNRHVVSDEQAEYTVFTNDGQSYDATVVARDPALDAALLKIEGDSFSHLTFGNSDELEVGQSVIAIGNALGEFRNTVSVGVVSGLARSIVASDHNGGVEALDQLIQTDTAINEGNSGGPLLNLDGEVIGVNVAIVSGAQNVGFALSANSVKSMVDSVKEHGRIVRPFIGVRYVQVTKSLQDKNNLAVDYGVLVQRGATPEDLAVIPGSPADKAGIVENDIILEVDGQKLEKGKSLASLIASKNVGDLVMLRVLHKGEEKTVTVILEEMEM